MQTLQTKTQSPSFVVRTRNRVSRSCLQRQHDFLRVLLTRIRQSPTLTFASETANEKTDEERKPTLQDLRRLPSKDGVAEEVGEGLG